MPWLLPIAALMLVGCGGPEVTRISGQVLLDGEPVDDVSLVFQPLNDITLGMFACYRNRHDGTFDIKPNPELGEGRAGKYRVLIGDARDPMKAVAVVMAAALASQKSGATVDPAALMPARIPVRYSSRSTDLQVTIHEGANDLPHFELTRP